MANRDPALSHVCTAVMVSLRAQPLEDGMIHPAEQIVIDALRAAIDFEAMVLYGSKCSSRGDILRLLARSVKSIPSSVALWIEGLAIRVLNDHEVDVRDAAIYALEMVGSARAVMALQAHVDPVPWLHGYAQHVANELTEESAMESAMDAGQDLVEKQREERADEHRAARSLVRE